MAKTATKTVPSRRTAAKLPVSAGKKNGGKGAAGDELSALVAANKEMEDVLRAQTGSQSSFITLVKANSGILDESAPNYIKGVKPLDFAIASKKIGLGKELDVTILGMFKVYAEVTSKEKESDMPKTVKFWHPEDAALFPVDGFFDRPLPNGNVLRPCHWVFVYLFDHPEIEDGLIPFQGKGNSIYSQLEKLIKAESGVCTELRLTVKHQKVYNDKFKKTDYYPEFVIAGHNYKLTEDGKVTKTKDGKVDAATLKEILTRSNKLQKLYQESKMVSRQNVTALPNAPSRAALPAGKAGYEDEEDEAVNF